MSAADPKPAMPVQPFGTLESETIRRPLRLPRLRRLPPALVRRAVVPAMCLAAGLAGLVGIALVRLG